MTGPDWGDVVRRSQSAVRRRRTFATAGALGVVAAGVASAYALGHPVIDFGKAQHGTRHEVNGMGSMEVGAPRGMAPGVLPHRTRRITAVRIDGKVHVLSVAPTKRGGFCFQWSNYVGGCRADRHDRFASRIEAGGSVGPKGMLILAGSFFQQRGDRLVMTFKDGATADVPFVWVTAPIDAGFYLYRVPDAHRRIAARAVSLALYDAGGKLLDREPILGPEPLPGHGEVVRHVRGFPPLPVRADGVWSKRRLLFDLRADNGARIGLWVYPLRGGGQCFVTNSASGCGKTSAEGLLALGFGGTRLCCGVSPRIVRVEARFQDGDRISLYPKEGYLIFPIPERHFPLGHRLVATIGFDAAGRAIARGRIPRPADQAGIYPCKTPKSLGYGVKRCA
ncbi:MAG: hypothetical protein ACJ76I_07355 [Gaiellaceae bacterium]